MKSFFLTVLLSSCCFLNVACNLSHRHSEEKEDGEVKMAFDKAPASVKAGLNRAAEGAKINEVDRELKNGATVYEADVMINGKNHEIVVAEDGTLISKKVDGEAEKDEKGKDEDDEEEDDD